MEQNSYSIVKATGNWKPASNMLISLQPSEIYLPWHERRKAFLLQLLLDLLILFVLNRKEFKREGKRSSKDD